MKKNVEISPNIETLFGTRDEKLRLLEDRIERYRFHPGGFH